MLLSLKVPATLPVIQIYSEKENVAKRRKVRFLLS